MNVPEITRDARSAPVIPAALERSHEPDLERTGLSRHITRRHKLALAEVAHHGSLKEAAACLGLSYQTIKNALADLYAALNAPGNGLSAALRLGWVVIPEAYQHREPVVILEDQDGPLIWFGERQ